MATTSSKRPMIEIKATLLRGTAYVAGEVIQCRITFTNISTSPDGLSSGKIETLAWASAQIHCLCYVSQSLRNSMPSNSLEYTLSNPTFFNPTRGEKGESVMSSVPKIMFCDLRLSPGESKSFDYEETISKDSPPTFRGHSVKYCYKITIGTQRLDSPTKLLRIPFRIFTVPGLNDLSVYEDPESRAHDLKPSNPFAVRLKNEPPLLEVAQNILSMVTARGAPHYYNISNKKGRIGRFCLFKESYKLGEDIIGMFDFSMADVQTLQYGVDLKTREVLAEGLDHQGSSHQYTYNRHHECCTQTLRTNFSIPIPLTTTPTFKTDLVSLHWFLHFEFVTLSQPLPKLQDPSDPTQDAVFSGPTDLDTDTFTWDVAIKVFPTMPLQCGSVSLMKAQVSIVA